MKCNDCAHYNVLNLREIVNKQPVKHCDVGEQPDSCRDYEKKEVES